MKIATESAQAGEPSESLEQVQQRFAQWRTGRQRGARIPKRVRITVGLRSKRDQRFIRCRSV